MQTLFEYRNAGSVPNGMPKVNIGKLINMERERTPFGQRMYEARKRAGLTQQHVCMRLDISQGTLSEAEHVANGSAYTARFAALYRVNAHWLTTGEADATGAPVVATHSRTSEPPRPDFSQRQVSDSDWATLQNVKLVLPESRLREIEIEAKRIRRTAAEQIGAAKAQRSTHVVSSEAGLQGGRSKFGLLDEQLPTKKAKRS